MTMNILDQSEKLKFELKKSVLLIKYRDGVLGCGYFNVETFNKTNEAAAIVTGVSNFEEMLEAKVVGVSKQAAQKGVMVGDSGKVALEKMAG
jgi:uncharacterized protein YunC (DUF1805 family)